jgi:dephospho-CoA kinase
MKGYEFDRRSSAQASDDERALVSDAVIVNDGDADQLLRAVEELLEGTLLPRARAEK